jgi:hypothetical protein
MDSDRCGLFTIEILDMKVIGFDDSTDARTRCRAARDHVEPQRGYHAQSGHC